MSHQSLNNIFYSYANTLYTAAARMIDKRNSQYEDKVQDLVLLAYEEFLRKADRGTIMDLPLLIHFMKLRRPEVQLEMRGLSRTSKTDVFNKRNYYEGKLQVYSIDNFDATYFRDVTNPEEELVSHIDFEEQLSSLMEHEQTIVLMKLTGYDENEIAQALSVQSQTVTNALKSLSATLSGKPSPQLSLNI
ncbi:MAG: ECF-type sigma factor [Bacteroidota bacterium]